MLESTPFSQLQGTKRVFFRNMGHRNVLLSQCSPISELCSYLLNFLIDICVRCMYACAIMEKNSFGKQCIYEKNNHLWGMYKTV